MITDKDAIKVLMKSPKNKRDSLVVFAMDYLGTPYKWGVESREGIDCSGSRLKL